MRNKWKKYLTTEEKKLKYSSELKENQSVYIYTKFDKTFCLEITFVKIET